MRVLVWDWAREWKTAFRHLKFARKHAKLGKWHESFGASVGTFCWILIKHNLTAETEGKAWRFLVPVVIFLLATAVFTQNAFRVPYVQQTRALTVILQLVCIAFRWAPLGWKVNLDPCLHHVGISRWTAGVVCGPFLPPAYKTHPSENLTPPSSFFFYYYKRKTQSLVLESAPFAAIQSKREVGFVSCAAHVQ